MASLHKKVAAAVSKRKAHELAHAQALHTRAATRRNETETAAAAAAAAKMPTAATRPPAPGRITA